VKLNDPFGRVGRRQQANYAAVRQQLQAEGVGSGGELDAIEQRLSRTFWIAAGVLGGITTLIVALAPAWQGLALVFAALGLLWAGSHFLQTRLYLKRYRRELEQAAASGGMHPDTKTTDGGNPR